MKELFRAEPGESYWGGVIKSMGLVFGDIGTSPIYTLTVVFALTRPTPGNVMGILSLVFWTLIVLREKILRLLRSGRKVAFAGFLTFLGVSLLLGDGVITPAISIMSAVEGTLLIPGLELVGRHALVAIAAVIAILLFAFQSRGTERVAWTFGPIMLIWFLSLAGSGLISLASMPGIAGALNPMYAVRFFQQNGFAGYLVLSEVILCATGGEALFADMGHLGRWPILRAWVLIFVALVINYLGQGAFILQNPEAKHLLFSMVRMQAPYLYIPFLVLTILATVIASQSIISGVFSIVYQGITTRLMPLLKIRYTSSKIQSQIYIGGVNWLLLCAVLFVIVLFEESNRLAAAYGLAVTGSMLITSVMMILIFSSLKHWKLLVAVPVCAVNLLYLFATFSKIPHGAYWSLVIGRAVRGQIHLAEDRGGTGRLRDPGRLPRGPGYRVHPEAELYPRKGHLLRDRRHRDPQPRLARIQLHEKDYAELRPVPQAAGEQVARYCDPAGDMSFESRVSSFEFKNPCPL